MRRSLILLSLLATFSISETIVYENAEDGDTAKWSIEDNTPMGATINRVYDDEIKSNVIELKGKDEENSFKLVRKDGKPWEDKKHFIIKWKQKSSSSFVIYVMVKTDKGDRYITFCNCPRDRAIIRGVELSFGLGHDADNGKWHEFEENLQEKLHVLMPQAKLLQVDGIIVRGSGRFDDIALTDGKKDIAPPNPPLNLSTSETTPHSVTLNWEDIEGEKGYKILRNGDLIATLEANTTTYTDTNLSANETYLYTVKSFNDAGESEGVGVEVTTPKEITPPIAPSNLKAIEIKPHSITIQWEDNSDNETGFEIYRNDLLITTTKPDTTTYTDTNLTADKEYLYIVKAINEAGKSEGANLEVTTAKESNTSTLPMAPKDLNATATSDSVTLNWSDIEGESGYEIFRDGELIATTDANVTTYTDKNLSAGESYTYEIKAVNDFGESKGAKLEVKTKEAVIEMSAPVNLAFIDVTPNSVTLTWEDTSDNETGFNIIRNGTLIATTEANVTTYTDSNLSPSTTYEYEIVATDGEHNSSALKDSITTPSGIPSDVTDLNATAASDSVTLNWSDIEGESGYEIFRDGELIATTEANVTTYTDKNLTSNTEYEYTVKAVNDFGESKGKNIKVKTTLSPVETYVMYLYHTVLDREPEKEGLKYWTKRLENGDSAADVAKGFFVITQELQSKNLSNEDYIKKIFITLYQREPLPGELAYWTKLLDEGALNRSLIFDKLVYTPEFVKLAKSYNLKPFDEDDMLYSRIESLYYLILKRKASYGEIMYWISLLKEGKTTYEQIVRDFFNSEEFKNKNVSDIDFIKAAYRSILNREPDNAGFRYWEHRLQNDLTRDELINYIFSSPEYQFISNLEAYKK